MRIDLQVHTVCGSSDSLLAPQELVGGCRATGLQGVAITEHSVPSFDEIDESLTSAGLLLIPGREVSFGSAHVLVLSPNRDLLRRLPRLIEPDDDALAGSEVACIWAHPAAVAGSGAYPPVVSPGEPASRVVHGVEVLNGRHLAFPATVAAAIELADALGLPYTGGSDAHQLHELGRCATEVGAESDDGAEGAVDAIRRGAVRPVLSRAWAQTHGYDYRDDLKRFLE